MNLTVKKTFGKAEKLCTKRAISELFVKGNSFIAYPLRVVFLSQTATLENQGISVLVSVSKKKFKRAVKRNKTKRLIREAYRLNKDLLLPILDEQTIHIDIAFIYLDSIIHPFEEFDKAIKKTARLLSEKMKGEK